MKKLIPALLVFLIIASCNKYEDGPKLSLRTRKARIINTWKVEKYMVGDVDYTASFKTAYPDYTVVFDKSGSYTISATYNSVVVSESGTWELSDSKSFLIRNETAPTVQTHSNEITRLKNDELNTKYYDSNGSLVEMQLVTK